MYVKVLVKMEFERDTELEEELLNEMAAAMYDPDRSQPSVSGMIRCITRTWYENYIKLDDGKPRLSRRETQLFAMGLALEKVLLIGRQNALYGETDGISWHIDSLNDSLLTELKSTRIKAVEGNEPNIADKWKKQWLSYAKALGITEGHFVIFHTAGDYAPPFPDIRTYKVITTQEEIDANWQWMQTRKDRYNRAVEEGKEPEPFQWNEEWECKDCPWFGLCNSKRILGELSITI